MSSPDAQPPALAWFTDHRRSFESFRYVYPVVSRRARGVSIGVNLNPDKVCNFDCIYCQVDRSTPGATSEVDRPRLLAELEATLDLVQSGQLWEHPRFVSTPRELRRLNDVAFSGDGEPTTCKQFAEVVSDCALLKRRRGLADLRLVLITNATVLHRPAVARGLALLAANQGEIWAKLEAGTEAYYQQIERTSVPFRQVLDNIAQTARRYPVIIQALFLRSQGQGPTLDEQLAFCDRLNEITAGGGRLARVQIYTVARRPAEPFVAPLADDEVDRLGALVRVRTGLVVETFYGAQAE